LLAVLPAPSDRLEADVERVLFAVVGGVAVATLVVGLLVGLTSQVRWTWLAALLGAWAQLAGYAVSMLMVPQSGGVEDDAAAVEVIMLSLPVLLTVTVLLWAGAGVGCLARMLRRWMRKRPTVRR
jgi:hypothetical protein